MSQRRVSVWLAGALALATFGTAQADEECPGGTGVTNNWHGKISYAVQLATSDAGTLVTWFAGDRANVPMNFAQLDASGSAPRPAQTDVSRMRDDYRAALVGGGSIYLQSWALGDPPSVQAAVRRLDARGVERGVVALGPMPSSGVPHYDLQFDGQHFLVTWWGEGTGLEDELLLSRLDIEGRLLDRTPIRVASMRTGGLSFNRAVRVGNVTWVVWENIAWNAEGIDTLGVRVADDGRVLDATPILLADDQATAALASNGDTALLYVHAAGGFQALRLTADGAPPALAGPVQPDEDPYQGIEVTPAARGDGFVLWSQRPVSLTDLDAGMRLIGQPVTPAGAIDGGPLVETDAGSVVRDGSSYVVVTVVEDASGDQPGAVSRQRLLARRFGSDGALVGETQLAVNTIELREDTYCWGPEPDGCSVGGEASGGYGLVALGLVAVSRRRRRSRAG